MEAKRGESALESKEKQAFKRMDQIRRDQEQRLAGLEQVSLSLPLSLFSFLFFLLFFSFSFVLIIIGGENERVEG